MEFKDGKFYLRNGKSFTTSYGNVIGIGPSGNMYSGYDGTLAEDVILDPGETMVDCWIQIGKEACKTIEDKQT